MSSSPEAGAEGEGAVENDGTRLADSAVEQLDLWYATKRSATGTVNRNVMAAALVVIEHMTTAYPLSESDYLATSQVKGLSGAKIRHILTRLGETRSFASEGGRTSRATVSIAKEVAAVLNASCAGYEYLTDDEMADARRVLQMWVLGKVRQDFFDKQRVKGELDPSLSLSHNIGALLRAAKARGGNAAGAVAQHLVGAKLTLRFPTLVITNDSYTTADQQTSRPGDFLVGDTAIHVTMSPSEKLMNERCRDNMTQSFRSFVLVPEDRVAAARQLAENAQVEARIEVQSIEDFVGINVQEMAGFQTMRIRQELVRLLTTYNSRVKEVEHDLSLQIELPANLGGSEVAEVAVAPDGDGGDAAAI